MGNHNLLSKSDQALVAYLISVEAGTSANVFTGKRASDLPNPPFVTCFSDEATPAAQPYHGSYSVSSEVAIYTNAAPTKSENTTTMRSASDTLVQNVFDAFHQGNGEDGSGLADLITAAAVAAGITNFTVQSVEVKRIEQGMGRKEGEWIDTISLEMLCYPS